MPLAPSSPLLSLLAVDIVRPEVTLCTASGMEFFGGTVVTKLKPEAKRRVPTVVDFADNSRGWTTVGDSQRRIRSMVVSCFRWGAAAQIEEAVANPFNDGTFQLVVPPITATGYTEAARRYLIRFFEADFAPQSRRGFRTQLFQATINDIEILADL